MQWYLGAYNQWSGRGNRREVDACPAYALLKNHTLRTGFSMVLKHVPNFKLLDSAIEVNRTTNMLKIWHVCKYFAESGPPQDVNS